MGASKGRASNVQKLDRCSSTWQTDRVCLSVPSDRRWGAIHNSLFDLNFEVPTSTYHGQQFSLKNRCERLHHPGNNNLASMSTEPAPSATRGDVTLQPAYFTSSLFVNPLREDIARLVQEYAQTYLQYSENNAAADQGVEATISSPSRQEGGPGPETTDSQTENTENHDIASTAYTSVPSMEGSALPNKSAVGPVHPKPFALFKQLWSSQGWCWFHLKALDGRARESFINVVLRLFLGKLIYT